MKSQPTRRTAIKNITLATGIITGATLYRNLPNKEERFSSVLEKALKRLESYRELSAKKQDRSKTKGARNRYSIPQASEYQKYLAKLQLRHFNPMEIVRPHYNEKAGVANNIPPEFLWPEIVSTLTIMDELRSRLNSKCTPLSIYRSKAYNTVIGGASRSQHMRNRAIDLKFDCGSDLAFKEALKMREEGLFRGGVGWYPSFIHLDTRGYNSTWGKKGV